MTVVSDEVLQYPFVEDRGLEVDEAYRALQQQTPIRIQLPVGDPCWLATRYDDVRTVFVDRRFSRQPTPGGDMPRMWPSNQTPPTVPLGMDPPEHTRIRRITSPVFAPKRIRALTDELQGHVDGLFDQMEAVGPGADFAAIVAWDLPVLALCKILGIPASDRERFQHWAEASTGAFTSPDERAEAHTNLFIYSRELIAERRAGRHDDLLGHLVNARDEGDRLEEDELLGIVMSLIVGGFETTATQLASSVYTLMVHPQHWQELVDGRATMAAALEELWRWVPGFRYGTMFARFATEDVELRDGFVIRAGEAILPEQPVANRDEAVFAHGWELDFHRANPRPHLALGFGEHLCMGIHLAKIQVQLTIETLVRRFPTVELAIPAAEVEWPVWMAMRSLKTLPLTW